MKRLLFYIALLLYLCAIPASAFQLIAGRPSGGAVFEGDIMNETFDSSEYDLTWSESGSPEPDDTTNPPTGSETGFSGHVLKIDNVWTAEYIKGETPSGASGDDQWYVRWRMYWTTEPFNSTTRYLAYLERLDDNPVLYIIISDPSSNGNMRVDMNCASPSGTDDTGSVTFTTGQNVEVEVELDNTNDNYTWQITIDGDTTVEGTDINCDVATNLRYFTLGSPGGDSYGAITLYIDDVDIDSSSFPTD
jgi:hypothetical protein